MRLRLKLALVAFGIALGFAAVNLPADAQGEQCTAHSCTYKGQSGTCCMIDDGTINCDPCGGFQPE